MTVVAPIGDYAGLVEALTERRRELGWSQLELDERAGWADGLASHLEHPEKQHGRTAGRLCLGLWLGALGVRLTVVEDPARRVSRAPAKVHRQVDYGTRVRSPAMASQ